MIEEEGCGAITRSDGALPAMATGRETLLVRELTGRGGDRPPFWFMRQAGRYLPEYQALRRREADFLRFCYTPELTIEAALQPLRRYGMDAAILFSDILVVPDAMGWPVTFAAGEGPVLEPLRRLGDVERLRADGVEAHLEPVFTSLTALVAAVPDEVAVIGFAGAPWTVALYMVEGRGGSDAETIRSMAYRAPDVLTALIETLTQVTASYLERQIACGADVVQLFDSWAGLLPEPLFRAFVIEPTKRIVKHLKRVAPGVPVIGFPRGAGVLYASYVRETGVDAVGLDGTMSTRWAADTLQATCALQGNLDNVLVKVGTDRLEDETARVLDALSGGRFVFNLGHGILPETPPEHVQRVCEQVRRYRRRPR
jgi:uroporphyrinogen decarboxylase